MGIGMTRQVKWGLRPVGRGVQRGPDHKPPETLHVNYARRKAREHVARVLGYALPRKAQVHHVDENPRNNANTNLVVCEDAAYHKLLHRRMRERRLKQTTL